jgi:hypothetical protein
MNVMDFCHYWILRGRVAVLLLYNPKGNVCRMIESVVFVAFRFDSWLWLCCVVLRWLEVRLLK